MNIELDSENITSIMKNKIPYESLYVKYHRQKNYSSDGFIYSKIFKTNVHQIVPKLYSDSNPDVRAIILSFPMGTGKTITAINIILNELHKWKALSDNVKMLTSSRSTFKAFYVIGDWISIRQFKNELTRPEFGLTNAKTELLEKPSKDANITEEQLKNKKLNDEATELVQFYGYQAFFNKVFPNITADSALFQNIEVLLNAYQKGELEPNTAFLHLLENRTIIIDECQRLYNSSGLNSYGFVIMFVQRWLNHSKIIMLSGTVLNTSVSEIVSLMNICKNTKSKKQFVIDDYCSKQKNALFDRYVINDERYKEISETMYPYMLIYDVDIIKQIKDDRNNSNVYRNNIEEEIDSGMDGVNMGSAEVNSTKSNPVESNISETDIVNVDSVESNPSESNIAESIPEAENSSAGYENMFETNASEEKINNSPYTSITPIQAPVKQKPVKRNHKNNRANIVNEKKIRPLGSLTRTSYNIFEKLNIVECEVPQKAGFPRLILMGNTPIFDSNNTCIVNLFTVNVGEAQEEIYNETIQRNYNLLINEDGDDRKEYVENTGKQHRREQTQTIPEDTIPETTPDDSNTMIAVDDSIMIKSEKKSEQSASVKAKYIRDANFVNIRLNKHQLIEEQHLTYDNLRKISALSATMLDICSENIKHDEKTVVYQNRVNMFGLMQLVKIFLANGYVGFGTAPTATSICRKCGERLKKHAYVKRHNGLSTFIEENVLATDTDIIHQHPFEPCVVAYVSGSTTVAERELIINYNYNAPANAKGEIISVLLITDIAVTGINILNTQNMIIMNKIPSISKYKQLYARICRYNSQMQLPLNQRYVKVFYLAASSEYEKDLIKNIDTSTTTDIINEQMSRAQKVIMCDIAQITERLKNFKNEQVLPKVHINTNHYYTTEFLYNYKHVMAFEDIEQTMKKLLINTVSYPLFIDPRRYKFRNDTEKQLLYKSYYQTLNVNLNPVLKYIFVNNNVQVLPLVTLIEMIKSYSEIHVSNLNYTWLDDTQLTDFILNNPKIKAFRFSTSSEINILYERDAYYAPPMVSFGSINIHSQNKDTVMIHKINADMSSDIPNKIIKGVFTALNNAMHNIENDKIDISEYPNLWKAAYALHCEYYENDETDFIKNHAISNRGIDKIAGMYFGNRIIMKDGTIRDIEYAAAPPFTSTYGKYLFKIKFGNKFTTLQFMLRLIFYINVGKDGRVLVSENSNRYVCNKCNRSLLYTLYKLSDINVKEYVDIKSNHFSTEQKGVLCGLLMSILCEVQNKKNEEGLDEKFITSPFELY